MIEKQHFSLMQYKDNCMHIIIVTGKRDDGEWVEDTFRDVLIDNKSSLGFTNIEEVTSDLIHLAISYELQRQDMLDTLGNRFTYKVFKLTFPEETFEINYELDELFRSCVFSFSEPINSTLFYLIKRDGEIDFHKVSNGVIHEERIVDDHLEVRGVMDDPDLFYRHFYGMDYTKAQIVEITKMMLVVGVAEAV